MADGEKKHGIVKTTLLGAVLVVVPVGIIGFALWQVGSMIRRLILPVIEVMPFDSTMTRVLVTLSALGAVILLCFLTGLAVRTRWGALVRRRIERRWLERIPGYGMIRTLAHQYLGHEGQRQFRPVLVDLYGSDSRALGFEIEVVGDGTVAVFLPSVPAVTIGQVQIVPEARITPIPGTMHATLETLAMFGMGSGALLGAGGAPISSAPGGPSPVPPR